MVSNKNNYNILAIVGALYIGVVYRYQTVPKYILISTAIFAACYVIWGITHHLRNQNFHARVVLEYLLVALLGVALVSTLLL